ncbi:26S proteasome non-ATPase regulatory subunit 4-like [Vitis vinifera]|uniref:26S proteasome non-ATPase regulatory subunit 4-like n=1 Tax=Vitis vinifera TaxID=29760 RepID=A0A438K658_VITVI|nr:26S proteasome non-ATPase regulatory subunit 4-like [Vitis vinifera]
MELKIHVSKGVPLATSCRSEDGMVLKGYEEWLYNGAVEGHKKWWEVFRREATSLLPLTKTLSKWSRRFTSVRESLWKQVIDGNLGGGVGAFQTDATCVKGMKKAWAPLRGNLLSWHESFVGKKRESLEGHSFVPFLDIMEGKKQEVFLRCRADDENALLQQALAMSMDDPATSLAMRDTDMSEAAADDQDLALALQLSVQDTGKDSTSQTDMSKLLTDQTFVSSILASLPGVDPNDPSVKDLLASMQNESESQQKKNEDKAPDEEDK